MPAKKAAKKVAAKPAKPAPESAAEQPAASKATEVKLGAAKGRPMLQWVGKRPLSRVTAFPAQLVEAFDPAGELAAHGPAKSGQLFHGDNKEVLAHLLANGYRGQVNLIYIDPPFDSAADYERPVWNRPTMEIAPNHLEQAYSKTAIDGRKYGLQELTAPGRRNGSTGSAWRGFDPNTLGRHWRWETKDLEAMFEKGGIYMPPSGGWPRLIVYRDDANTTKPASDWWDDVSPLFMSSSERADYPTQKPEDLVSRVIEASTHPEALVLDCFIGSGTTAAVAQKLGRRWIGCDINKGAI